MRKEAKVKELKKVAHIQSRRERRDLKWALAWRLWPMLAYSQVKSQNGAETKINTSDLESVCL